MWRNLISCPCILVVFSLCMCLDQLLVLVRCVFPWVYSCAFLGSEGLFHSILSSLGLVTVPLVHVYGKLINSGGNLSSGKVGGDVAERPLHPFSPDR